MSERLFARLDPATVRVSVAMATYNGARFLEEQLDSIARQIRSPDELVVSDDGSTDNTLALVARFAERAPFPVRVLGKQARLGFADNFLHAAGECQGNVVAFCDQDDVWLPRKLEVGLARLIGDDSLLSLHRLTVTDAALRPAHLHAQGIARDAVFGPLAIDPQAGWGNTMMFRRELALLIPRDERPPHPGLDRLLSHDTWLYLLAAALGRVSHIAEPLILYRQHGANTAGVTPPSLSARAADLHVNPVAGFRRKRALDTAIAALLATLAERETGELSRRAITAAVALARRAEHLGNRAETYEGVSLAARAAAYLRVLGSLSSDRAVWRRAWRVAGKDLLLGVTGIDRRRRAQALLSAPTP